MIRELLDKVEKDKLLLPDQGNNFFSLKAPVDKKRLTFILLAGIILSAIVLFFNPSVKSRPILSLPVEISAVDTQPQAQQGGDLFSKTPEAPPPPKASVLPSLILKGIVFETAGDCYAFINDKRLKEKDSIDGVQITKIYQDKVEVLFDEKVYELMLVGKTD